MSVLDTYVLKPPSDQNILDIFEGEWSSRLPEGLGLVTRPGTAPLFEDPRVVWAEENLGSFADMAVLELGPLEGGHSYMLQDRGVRSVLAVEANTHAFLKCLCVKEVLGLDRVRFELGDFTTYLSGADSAFDVVFASGVLYHMQEPVELLDSISKVTGRVYIWTHYYDPEVVRRRKDLQRKLGPVRAIQHGDVTYEGVTQAYKGALRWDGFCGGSKPVSTWLTRESILEALRRFGFTDIRIGFEEPDHQNGPAFAICASKERR